jgi:hypothetical protein
MLHSSNSTHAIYSWVRHCLQVNIGLLGCLSTCPSLWNDTGVSYFPNVNSDVNSESGCQRPLQVAPRRFPFDEQIRCIVGGSFAIFGTMRSFSPVLSGWMPPISFSFGAGSGIVASIIRLSVKGYDQCLFKAPLFQVALVHLKFETLLLHWQNSCPLEFFTLLIPPDK